MHREFYGSTDAQDPWADTEVFKTLDGLLLQAFGFPLSRKGIFDSRIGKGPNLWQTKFKIIFVPVSLKIEKMDVPWWTITTAPFLPVWTNTCHASHLSGSQGDLSGLRADGHYIGFWRFDGNASHAQPLQILSIGQYWSEHIHVTETVMENKAPKPKRRARWKCACIYPLSFPTLFHPNMGDPEINDINTLKGKQTVICLEVHGDNINIPKTSPMSMYLKFTEMKIVLASL